MTNISDIVLNVITTPPYNADLKDGFETPARAAEYGEIPAYLLQPAPNGRPSRASRWIESVPAFEQGWWTNQSFAGEFLGAGDNVIQTTSTASGKTTAHIGHALHVFDRNPKSRTVFFYTTKALLVDQHTKLVEALRASGAGTTNLGVLNGNIEDRKERFEILKRSRILLATPDIFHSFVLPHLNHEDVAAFMRDLEFMVIDEAHLYTDILGSNAPFFFRRIEFARDYLRGLHQADAKTDRLQIAAASASLRDASGFMERLTGQPFVEVGQKEEGAARHVQQFMHVAADEDQLAMAKKLIVAALQDIKKRQAADPDHPVEGTLICFIESRSLVEKIAEEINRETGMAVTQPVRSGYNHDEIIQEIKLGNIKVVLATSVWQQGIDLPDMSVVICVGVPNTPGALQQSFGRAGRHGAGLCIAVAPANEFLSRDLSFRDFLRFRITRPVIYLDDVRVQIANALCLQHEARLLGADTNKLDINTARYAWPKSLGSDEDLPSILQRLRTGHMLVDIAFAERIKQNLRTPHSIFGMRHLTKSKKYDLVVNGADGKMNVIGEVEQRKAVRECGPGMYYRHSGKFVVNRWIAPTKECPRWRIHLHPTTKPGETFPRIMKFVNIDTNRRLATRRYTGAYGSMMEYPLHVSERYNGYSRRKADEKSGDKSDDKNHTVSVDHDGPRSPYTFHNHTSGIILQFANLEFEKDELLNLSRYLKESFCRVMHRATADINVAHRHIYPTYNPDNPPEEMETSIAIYDASGDQLRITRSFIDNLQSITAGMVELHPNDPVVEKFVSFVVGMKIEERKPSAQIALPSGVTADFKTESPSGTPHEDLRDETVDVILPGTPVWYTPPSGGDTRVKAEVDRFETLPKDKGGGLVYHLRPHPLSTQDERAIFRRRGGTIQSIAKNVSRDLKL